MKQGTLYIVSTPIGNLEDITLRAIRVLKDVQLIAAEDTRRTKILLNAYAIETSLTSLYDQNELKKSVFLIEKLNDGMDIAYVSDAGTPGISDPGYILVKQALAYAINVVPIPGPSAVITALCVCGLPIDQFSFYGFLPSRSSKRKNFLQSLKNEEKTMIFYESPNRLMSTLEEVQEVLGNREIVICRELTKLYEENLRGKVGEVIDSLKGRKIKGEITVVLSGREKGPLCYSTEDILKRFKELQKNTDLSTRDSVNIISEEAGISRKTVYRDVLEFLRQ